MEQTFAHPIEAELASLLDAHGIRWLYEPHDFRLAHGSFVPDFFLPDIGIYVECTVAGPRRVTRKRAKAREAHERYGAIVNVLDRRDFARFAAEHGLVSETLRVDVDHRGEPRAPHRGRCLREQPSGPCGNTSRLGGLRDQLGAIAPAKAK
jgi:hypothetical protein